MPYSEDYNSNENINEPLHLTPLMANKDCLDVDCELKSPSILYISQNENFSINSEADSAPSFFGTNTQEIGPSLGSIAKIKMEPGYGKDTEDKTEEPTPFPPTSNGDMTEENHDIDDKEKEGEEEEGEEFDDVDGKCFAKVYDESQNFEAPHKLMRHIGPKILRETCTLVTSSFMSRSRSPSPGRFRFKENVEKHRKRFQKLRQVVRHFFRPALCVRGETKKTTPTEDSKPQNNLDENCGIERYIVTADLEPVLGQAKKPASGAACSSLSTSASSSVSTEENLLETGQDEKKLTMAFDHLDISFENDEQSEVFICDPEAKFEEQKVSFGMKVVTICEEDYLLHICVDIEEDGLAQQFGFRNHDEILMVNSERLINRKHKDVIRIFSQLNTKEVITLISRRYLNLEDHFEKNEDIEVEYIRVIGEVLVQEDICSVHVDDREVQTAFASQTVIKQHDELYYFKRRAPIGALCFDGDTLSIRGGNIDSSNMNQVFQVFHCIHTRGFYKVDIIKASESNHFLAMDGDDSVIMEERDVDDKGFPTDTEGLLFRPTASIHNQQYQIIGDKKKYLAWDDETGIAIQSIMDDDDLAGAQFIFELHSTSEDL